MLPQAAPNEIFFLWMRYNIRKLRVKYLTPGDTGWDFMIDDRYIGCARVGSILSYSLELYVIERGIIDLVMKILGTITEKCLLPVLSTKNDFTSFDLEKLPEPIQIIFSTFFYCVGCFN